MLRWVVGARPWSLLAIVGFLWIWVSWVTLLQDDAVNRELWIIGCSPSTPILCPALRGLQRGKVRILDEGGRS